MSTSEAEEAVGRALHELMTGATLEWWDVLPDDSKSRWASEGMKIVRKYLALAPPYVAWLRTIRDAAAELDSFLHKTMTADPETSPIAITCRGDDADLYAKALRDRMQTLHEALAGWKS